MKSISSNERKEDHNLCPECPSADVDVFVNRDGDKHCTCKGCGSRFIIESKLKVLNESKTKVKEIGTFRKDYRETEFVEVKR